MNMKTIISLSIALSIMALISSCSDEKEESNKIVFNSKPTVSEAMLFIYSNNGQTPKKVEEYWVWNWGWKFGLPERSDEHLTKVVLSEFINIKDTNYYILVSATGYGGEDSHLSAVTYGMFIFREVGYEWVEQTLDYSVDNIGIFGINNAVKPKLEIIGQYKFGLVFIIQNYVQDFEYDEYYLYTLHNNNFTRSFYTYIYSKSESRYEPYTNTISETVINFVRNKSEYFDLTTTTKEILYNYDNLFNLTSKSKPSVKLVKFIYNEATGKYEKQL